jgi:hypothetical protein
MKKALLLIAPLAALCVFAFPAEVCSQAPVAVPVTHHPVGALSFLIVSPIPTGYVGVTGTNTADAGGNVVANGTISFQPVSNNGSPISFRAAGGTGAAATATFGVVIDTQTPGAGYGGSWTCSVTGGTYTTQATCAATVSSSGGLIFAITSPGTYTAPPATLTVSGGSYTAGTLATVALSLAVQGVSVASGGAGYGGTIANFPGCAGVTGTAVTVYAGAVTAINAAGGWCPAGSSVVIVSEGQAGPEPVFAQVTNGVFATMLADTALSYPANVCYNVTITDNVSGASLLGPGYSCVQPAGSGPAVSGASTWCSAATSVLGGRCNFDIYSPNLAPLALSQNGAAGPAGADGLIWMGAWNSTTAYVATDIVQYGGSSYVASAASTNVAPPNAAYWSLLAAGGSGGSTPNYQSLTAASALTLNCNNQSATFYVLLASNVAATTLTNCPSGATITFQIRQNSSGTGTFSFPSQVLDGMGVPVMANTVSIQSFLVGGDGNLYATGPQLLY